MKLLWYLSFIVLCSCSIINPDEREPAYLVIGDYDLQVLSGQGADTDGITELWVYANSDILGVYDLPARIPVLNSGNTRIAVFGGIKNNGVSTTRIRYPFYALYDTTLNLEPLKDYNVSPVFNYSEDVVIDATRSFENGNMFQPATAENQGSAELITNSNIARTGLRCGKFSLSSGESYMQFLDDGNIEITSGVTSFLELDYSCNNTFAVGLYTVQGSSSSKNPMVYITPTNEGDGSLPVWNKIYLDLGLVASNYPNADYYRIYIECYSNESATPTIYLDNLKYVHW